MSANNNRIIIKNSIMLYFRLFVCLGIAFISSRELLSVIGEIDYGLINVVSGIVTMFSFLSHMLTSAVSRYYTYDLGKNDFVSLKKIFNISQIIFLVLCLIIFILSETIGLWFFYYKILIPSNRIDASFYFYQCSIISFLFQVMTIPYNALIIAHENMRAYAFISIIQSILKLVIIYTLRYSCFDMLIFYGFLLTLINLLTLIIYIHICHKNYSESLFEYYWNTSLFKELFVYSGWNLFGAMSNLFSNFLVNVLLNNYFGPSINAARAISIQVSSAVSSFMNNFLVAAKPQITKYWASGKKEEMFELVYRSSKCGFFLMLLMAMPVLFETNFLFTLWLKQVPNYTIVFSRLIIIGVLIDTLSIPLMTCVQASGKVALYQFVVGTMRWLNFPISWLCLNYDYPPESIMYTTITINIVCLFFRLILVKRVTGLPISVFFSKVIFKVIVVCIFSFIMPIIFSLLFQKNIYCSIIQCFFCALSVLINSFVFGFTTNEQKIIFNEIKKRLKVI